MKIKWCWTCGGNRDPRDFNEKPSEYDGLAAECKRGEEARELARKLDGETAPRTYSIQGEGRKAPPLALGQDRTALALDAALRRRPRSGLLNVEYI